MDMGLFLSLCSDHIHAILYIITTALSNSVFLKKYKYKDKNNIIVSHLSISSGFKLQERLEDEPQRDWLKTGLPQNSTTKLRAFIFTSSLIIDLDKYLAHKI